MIYPSLDHWAWLVAVFLLGGCIGSFLNVVIHRLPLGLSVGDPKRSFCPKCKAAIPMRRNLPILSWLLLRGRCADCREPISPRYLVVEILTGLLFAAVWAVAVDWLGGDTPTLAHLAILPLWFMTAAFVAIAFIDAEHQIIPLELTISGTVAGLLGGALWPRLPNLVAWPAGPDGWLGGLWLAFLGGVIGFFGLWSVVLLGKLAFGRMKWQFDAPVPWYLEEPKSDDDPIHFHMGDRREAWWDLFFRASDRLIIEADSLRLDGEDVEPGQVVIRERKIHLPDGREIDIESLNSLDGTAAKAVIPREAMGMGDVHLMGMIGAFFGVFGVFFSLFAASLYAIFAALLGRVGFGVRLPFGPFLILGALTWWFGGWKLAEWYLLLVR